MSDLIDRWLALPSRDYALLRRYGISFKAAQIVGGVRAAKDGRLILPVYDDPPSIYRSVEDPVLLALLAFDPADPDRWTLWPEGLAVMLGEAALREARYYNDLLPVYRNPLNWLRAGGGGVMPCDWPAFVHAVLWTPEIELVAEAANRIFPSR
jgi:hypothetical protein